MFAMLKYLPALMIGKDITVAYKEEQGKDKPAWLSGRVLGLVASLIGIVLSIGLGINLDTGQINAIGDSFEKIGSAGLVLYGIIRMIVGQVQASKRKGSGNGNT